MLVAGTSATCASNAQKAASNYACDEQQRVIWGNYMQIGKGKGEGAVVKLVGESRQRTKNK